MSLHTSNNSELPHSSTLAVVQTISAQPSAGGYIPLPEKTTKPAINYSSLPETNVDDAIPAYINISLSDDPDTPRLK